MQTDQHIPEKFSYTTERKTAAQLKVGDKILGTNNFLLVNKIRPGIAGIFYPILEMTDAYGKKYVRDTGQTARIQDSTFVVEKKTPLKAQPSR